MARAAERRHSPIPPAPVEEPDYDPRGAFRGALDALGLEGLDADRALAVAHDALQKLASAEREGDGWWRSSAWLLAQGLKGVTGLAQRKPDDLYGLVSAWCAWACAEEGFDEDPLDVAGHFEASWERVRSPYRFIKDGADFLRALAAAADDPPELAVRTTRELFLDSPVMVRMRSVLLRLDAMDPGKAFYIPTRVAARAVWGDETRRDKAGRLLAMLVRRGLLCEVERAEGAKAARYRLLLGKSLP